MADKKITALTALATPDDADVLPIVDVSAGETKKITVANFPGLPSQWSKGTNGDVTATVDDGTKVPLTIEPETGQSEALLLLKNEAGDEAIEGFANGSINQYLTDPAVIGWLIKAAASQSASVLRVTNSNNSTIFDFVVDSGEIDIRTPGGAAFSAWYAQSFAGYSESDLLMNVVGVGANQGGSFELDVFVDKNVAANNYSHLYIKMPSTQAAADAVIRVWPEGSGNVFRVLPSGAIITAAHAAPADASIATGEMALWFDQTNGAAYLMTKSKTADGTVVTGRVRLGHTVQTYSESNVTTDRTYDANATSIDELADVLGTLIADLRAQGVVG